MLFTVTSMKTSNVSGVFIQIVLTHFFDLFTGKGLKRWLQQVSLLESQVVEATTQSQVSRAKTVRPIRGRKSRVTGEQSQSRTCSIEKDLRRVKPSNEQLMRKTFCCL